MIEYRLHLFYYPILHGRFRIILQKCVFLSNFERKPQNDLDSIMFFSNFTAGKMQYLKQ